MHSSWRNAGAGERYAAPVEMRFIDMFMAALGALCFMAMLFAFQMRFMGGPTAAPNVASGSNQALQLLTKSLPPGRVSEPYEIAFAYRGGDGAVSWEIKSATQETRAGMKFDEQRGTLSGVPQKTGKIRFVLIARDAAGRSDEKPYELAIEPKRAGPGQAKKWLAIVTLVIAGLAWLLTAVGSRALKLQVQEIEAAREKGAQEVEIQTSPFTKEVIQLPGGLDTYNGRLQATRGMSRFLFLIVLALAVWFYFSL